MIRWGRSHVKECVSTRYGPPMGGGSDEVKSRRVLQQFRVLWHNYGFKDHTNSSGLLLPLPLEVAHQTISFSSPLSHSYRCREVWRKYRALWRHQEAADPNGRWQLFHILEPSTDQKREKEREMRVWYDQQTKQWNWFDSLRTKCTVVFCSSTVNVQKNIKCNNTKSWTFLWKC